MPLTVKISSKTYSKEFEQFTLDETFSELKDKIWTLKDAFTTKEREEKNLKLKIICNGNVLTGEHDSCQLKSFKKSKFKMSKLVFTVTIDAKGGSMIPKKELTFPEEVISYCKQTTCRIMTTRELCYKLNCGCWVSFHGIRGEVHRLFRISHEKLACEKHCKDWNLEDVLYICNFDQDTEDLYQKEFTKRKLGVDTTECPKCHTMGTRPTTVTLHRLACGRCGLNYCLHCEKKWISIGMVLCGNKECDTYDIQLNLDNCKDISHSSTWIQSAGGPVPEIRACPKCITLITHTSLCQHMTCPSCRYDFCFICLKPWYDNCYSDKKKIIHILNDKIYKNGCKIAPRQKFG